MAKLEEGKERVTKVEVEGIHKSLRKNLKIKKRTGNKTKPNDECSYTSRPDGIRKGDKAIAE